MPYRLDAYRIDSHEMVGDRLRVDGHLSRTGVQIYDQGDGTKRREQRDASEVFAPAALASMRAMPVTVGHPDLQMLDGQNWRALAHGHVGDDVRKGEDGTYTMASIWVMDAATQKRVIDGDLVELSVGYFAALDETPGVNDKGEKYDARQIDIRGNHLALLPVGRARGGRGCKIRLDSDGNARYESEDLDEIKREKISMKIKVRADGIDHEVEADSDSLVVALDRERAESKGIVDEMQKHVDELKAKLDAEIEAAKEIREKLAAETDPKKLQSIVDETIKIRDQAKLVAGKDLEYTGSATELRSRALAARGISTEGKTDAYIEARFDAVLESAGREGLAGARIAAVGAPGERTDLDNEAMNLADLLAERLAGHGGE